MRDSRCTTSSPRHVGALAAAIGATVSMAGTPLHAAPAALEFSDGFLIGGKTIDMQRYARAGQLEAGVHPLDVVVNGDARGTQDIVFSGDVDNVQP
ncbi:MAG TPA: hypothetical protein DCM50_06645, partial [Stenotrophomonas sp.]|nr:hypothetical protein [Stenotrophomonas sp.]